MSMIEDIQKVIKSFDDLHQELKEYTEDYAVEIKEMSKLSSLGLDADLARAQRIIIQIRRDLEKAREET